MSLDQHQRAVFAVLFGLLGNFAISMATLGEIDGESWIVVVTLPVVIVCWLIAGYQLIQWGRVQRTGTERPVEEATA